jgi:hypothetical protein
MAKDKVVELVQGKPAKEDVKKALCTITLPGENLVFKDVAGYQLLEGVLIILIHEGPTHLIPINSFNQAIITANKE